MKILKQYNTYLSTLLPIINSTIYKNELTIYVESNKLLPILFFLKNHTNCQFKILSDLGAIDYSYNTLRFNIVYNLLSINFNTRIRVSILIHEFESIHSISPIFQSANWLEREIWDMFGIFLKNHIDLRRILTDYGFEGYPLRKDFPLTGFVEIFYNELNKRIIYKPINLSQAYRLFEYNPSWSKYK